MPRYKLASSKVVRMRSCIRCDAHVRAYYMFYDMPVNRPSISIALRNELHYKFNGDTILKVIVIILIIIMFSLLDEAIRYDDKYRTGGRMDGNAFGAC